VSGEASASGWTANTNAWTLSTRGWTFSALVQRPRCSRLDSLCSRAEVALLTGREAPRVGGRPLPSRRDVSAPAWTASAGAQRRLCPEAVKVHACVDGLCSRAEVSPDSCRQCLPLRGDRLPSSRGSSTRGQTASAPSYSVSARGQTESPTHPAAQRPRRGKGGRGVVLSALEAKLYRLVDEVREPRRE
jgi:hypothetical protein